MEGGRGRRGQEKAPKGELIDIYPPNAPSFLSITFTTFGSFKTTPFATPPTSLVVVVDMPDLQRENDPETISSYSKRDLKKKTIK